MLPHPILDQICIQLWDTVSFHKIKMMHFFFKVVNIDRVRYKLKPFTVTIDSAHIFHSTRRIFPYLPKNSFKINFKFLFSRTLNPRRLFIFLLNLKRFFSRQANKIFYICSFYFNIKSASCGESLLLKYCIKRPSH